MRTSFQGSSDRHPQRGVTLVELLIVVTIMGLMAGLVVMTVPRPTPLRDASERLQREIVTIRDDAVVTSRARGLSILPSGLAVFDVQNGAWVEIATYPVPPTLSLELSLDTEWELPEHDDDLIASLSADDEGEDEEGPQIRFSPLGEVTPFALVIVSAAGRVEISFDAFGVMEVATYGGA